MDKDILEEVAKLSKSLGDPSEDVNEELLEVIAQVGPEVIKKAFADMSEAQQTYLKATLEKAKKSRCWEGYKPVKGKKAYSEDSCEPVSKAKDTPVTMTAKEAVDEHENLVNVLETPSKKDDAKEAKKQKAELTEYKAKLHKSDCDCKDCECEEVSKGGDMTEEQLLEELVKAKYISRKRVGNKWVYEYPKAGSDKPAAKKEESDKESNAPYKKPISGKVEEGKVLWFSERDGNGIIKDAQGNEHYVDISVIKDRGNLKAGSKVEFKANRLSDGTLVAQKVSPISSDSKSSDKKSGNKISSSDWQSHDGTDYVSIKHADGENFKVGRLNEIKIEDGLVLATDGYRDQVIGTVNDTKEAKKLAEEFKDFYSKSESDAIGKNLEAFKQQRRQKLNKSNTPEEQVMEKSMEAAMKAMKGYMSKGMAKADCMAELEKAGYDKSMCEKAYSACSKDMEKASALDDVAFPEADALKEKVMVSKEDKRKEQDEVDEKMVKPENAQQNHQGSPTEGWEGQIIKSKKQFVAETLELAKSMGITKENLKEAIVLAKGNFELIREALEKQTKTDTKEAKVEKSFNWDSPNKLLKANTLGRNTTYTVEETIVKSYEAPQPAEENLAKSSNPNDINEMIAKGYDQDSARQEEIEKSRKIQPKGAYTVNSFDLEHIASALNISLEKAQEILGLEKGNPMEAKKEDKMGALDEYKKEDKKKQPKDKKENKGS